MMPERLEKERIDRRLNARSKRSFLYVSLKRGQVYCFPICSGGYNLPPCARVPWVLVKAFSYWCVSTLQKVIVCF